MKSLWKVTSTGECPRLQPLNMILTLYETVDKTLLPAGLYTAR